jgi:hypothetical protein
MHLPHPRRPGGSRSRLRTVPVAIIVLLLAALSATPVAAATTNQAWLARLGGLSALNGTVTVNAYTTGNGIALLRLKGLARATAYSSGIYRGSCTSLGSRIVAMPIIRTTSTGTLASNVSLTASAVSAMRTATKSPGRMAFVLGGGSLRKCATFTNLTTATTAAPCGTPDVCMGQPVSVESYLVTVTGVERWSGDVDADPIPGYTFMTVRVRITLNSIMVAPGSKLNYPGLTYRVTTPTKLTWYDLKSGVVRQPILAPGAVSFEAPLEGWLTFAVPTTEAGTLRLAPVPGIYVRLY